MNSKIKRLRPTVKNRRECVDRILNGLLERSAQEQFGFLSSESFNISGVLLEQNDPGAYFDLVFAVYDETPFAAAQVLKENDWDSTRRLYAYLRMAFLHNLHERLKLAVIYSSSDSHSRFWVMLHGWAIKAGDYVLAEQISAYLYNQFICGRADVNFQEDQFPIFYWSLLLADARGHWPTAEEITSELGYFRPLFDTVSDPGAFKIALEAYCDFRLGRSYHYSTPASAEPRCDSDPASIFELDWIAYVPFELWFFQAIYRKCTGRVLSLACDHPLLNTRFVDMPSMLPLFHDEFMQKFEDLGFTVYGNQWLPHRRVDRLDGTVRLTGLGDNNC